MTRFKLYCNLTISLSMLAFNSSAHSQNAQPVFNSGLSWRNIGPFRGGRVSAVTGAVGHPGLFYMGLPAGGVWRSTSAGTTWVPVFDAIKEVSSVGSIEVAPSDPNVIYVGMGDMPSGGGGSMGNGVYKSIDAGATWKNIGLPDSARIPSILVDPKDSNIVMAACLGTDKTKAESRGLFRSIDGGKTWKRTLFVDADTSVQKIAWAFENPKIIIASTSRAGQGRGFGGGAGAGGQAPAGTKLYKSTDEGMTWAPLAGTGLPTIIGRTCVAIAMHTNSQRMFIVGNFGLYRSDDGGTNWRKMATTDRRIANGQGGYNCGVYVDSQNPDVVYVLSTCSYKSTDGGKTFTGFKGAPGGDDPQQLWIDPLDGKRMLMGVDQGATISLDGGLSWSSWYNQSTAQVYHVSVDNQTPYWVYGAQQDSGTVASASRGIYGAITTFDWLPHPGYEFGTVAIDPLNPRISYAGGPAGGIIKTTYPSGQWIDIGPSVDSRTGLRKVLNQPLIFSPKNPKELLAGYQFLMASTDGGKSWRKISPDISLVKGAAPATPPTNPAVRPTGRPTVPVTPAKPPKPAKPTSQMVADQDVDDHDSDKDADEEEAQRGFGGGAIDSISVSTLNGDIIWVGTSNGQIRVTQDHGKTWDDVAIPDLPNGIRSDIASIDASHHEIGTAYVAVDCHNAGDLKPYLYRTKDFGKSWTLIVNGLPVNEIEGSFARVVRADTVRSGLLFAGTESFVYASLDDGEHWQSISLDLPNTSYRDLVIKDADLVAGTFGRGFYILDDISPLRQLSSETASKSAYLFKPADALRYRRNVNDATPFPPEIPHAINPPVGAIIYYNLATKPSGEISIVVQDAKGNIVRHMSSAKPVPFAEPPPSIPDFWVAPLFQLTTNIGLNRTNWDLRYDSPATFSHSYEINANPGETPATPEGPIAIPGTYTVIMIVDGKEYKQSVSVRNDPRSPASARDIRDQNDLQMKVYSAANEAKDMFTKVTAIRTAVDNLLKSSVPADVDTAGTALSEKLVAITGTSGFGRRFGGGGGFGGGSTAPVQPSFNGINGAAVRCINMLDSGDIGPTESMRKACEAVVADKKTATKIWETLKAGDLADFNKLLVKNNLQPIPVDIK